MDDDELRKPLEIDDDLGDLDDSGDLDDALLVEGLKKKTKKTDDDDESFDDLLEAEEAHLPEDSFDDMDLL
ncbi:MAG: hypothetical protein CEO12_261 [Parcubacteria group bacterium Gr01-1014_46]|nr:MAG: hypothetical protein CEO12_261 [Parcubacteria group bacterium Gr01-1014_46]